MRPPPREADARQRRAREEAEAKERDRSRRSVRDAAERARWQLDYESPRPAAERGEQKPWHPTQAEVRWLDRAVLDQQWSRAIRRAAAAQFPRQSVELGNAAYLAGHLVVGERIAEDTAMRHLHAAAKRAGLRPAEVERVVQGRYLLGRGHAFGELSRGGVEGHEPGAFTAVASATTTYDHDNQLSVDPGALVPLPAAVLVHAGHDIDRSPVAVGVPSMRDGVVHLDAVFASQDFDRQAGHAWTLTRKGRIRSVSIFVAMQEYYRGVNGRLVKGTLVCVDLVRSAADDKASIGKVIAAGAMTPGQRQTQRLFNRYLEDQRNPLGRELFTDAVERGAEALNILAPVVAPLVAERAGARLSSASESAVSDVDDRAARFRKSVDLRKPVA